jgi:mannose-6-phosphate isomerase-like protein (cupin superfamily)
MPDPDGLVERRPRAAARRSLGEGEMEGLRAAAVRLLGRALPEGQSSLIEHLAAAAAPGRPPAAAGLSVLAWLERLPPPPDPDARRLVDLLVARASRLTWRRTYDPGVADPAFLERYGWAELVGPFGPWPSERARLGFLLLGPETLYPAHAHAAEEIYLVVAGTAAWWRGQGPWEVRPPGALIHHPSRTPHATRTGAEPLLALYLWWGEALREHAAFVPGGGPRHG